MSDQRLRRHEIPRFIPNHLHKLHSRLRSELYRSRGRRRRSLRFLPRRNIVELVLLLLVPRIVPNLPLLFSRKGCNSRRSSDGVVVVAVAVVVRANPHLDVPVRGRSSWRRSRKLRRSRGRGEMLWLLFDFWSRSVGSCNDELDFDEVRPGLVVVEVEESNDVSRVLVAGESDDDEGALVGDVETRWRGLER